MRLIFLSLLVCSSLVFAEDKKRNLSNNIINHTVAEQYRAQIIPELFSEIQSGSFVMEVGESSRFLWRFDDEWEKNSKNGHEKLTDFDPVTFLAQGMRGIPFQTKILPKDNAGFHPDSARKILWNIQAHFWQWRYTRFHYELLWLQNERIAERFHGSIERVHPLFGEAAGVKQSFREKVSLSYLTGYDPQLWLTFRFLTPREDLLWVLSPATTQTRQVSSSNRSDPLYRTPVSLDDFFSWSVKPELVDARIDTVQDYFIPIADMQLSNRVRAGKSCHSILQEEKAVSEERLDLDWNVESKRYFQAEAWVPTRSIFIPRKLWRIVIEPKDSFSLSGKQILYVDDKGMMPVYKVVYKTTGERWKTVMTSYGLAISQDRKEKNIYPSYTVVVDHLQKNAAIIDYYKLRFCKQTPDGVEMSSFDPNRLVQKQEKVGESQKQSVSKQQ